MNFIYDVCIHDDGDYREQPRVDFTNPVHVGETIKAGIDGEEYEVFQIVHAGFCNGSVIHARPRKAI